MFKRFLKALPQQTGQDQARLGAAAQHLLHGIEHISIDALAESKMQSSRARDVIDRNHGGALKQECGNLRGAAQSCGQRQSAPDGASPLPGQRGRYLLLGDKSQGLQPFSDSAPAGETLGLDRDAQFIRRNLLARQQHQAERNPMRRRNGRLIVGSNLCDGLAENVIQAGVGAIPLSTHQNFPRPSAQAAPPARSMAALPQLAGRTQFPAQSTPCETPGVKLEVSDLHNCSKPHPFG